MQKDLNDIIQKVKDAYFQAESEEEARDLITNLFDYLRLGRKYHYMQGCYTGDFQNYKDFGLAIKQLMRDLSDYEN